MEILVSVAAKIAEYTVAPIGRHMGYMFSFTHNFQKLADQLEELVCAKATIGRRVNVERRNGKEIKDVVVKWLDKVDKITEQAKQLCEDPYREKVGCSKCSFPNLWQRHQLSWKATKAANNVAHVLGEGKKFERDEIGFLPAIGGVGSTSATSRFVDFESRMSKMNEIMQTLTDPKVSLLGVYGLGGVGKTTLVDQVARKAKNDNLFDEVVMASVTKTPDLERIQGEIADQLGMQFTLEGTVLGRAYRLRQRINMEKNILIILDDIWATMKLEDIGIPYRDKIYMENKEMESQDDHMDTESKEIESEGDHLGCKVLLISRNQDVLQHMGTQKDFRLEVLSELETWRLFGFMAGDVAEDASYQDIAIEVAKKCAGLPVLIVTVAMALKHKGIAVWEDALSQLARVDNKELHEITYSALEMSYNQLESNEIKPLFLLCGVEGPCVAVEDLLKYIMGFGVFKHTNSLKDARNRLHTLVKALEASCLLLEDTDAKFVRMHDIVHEVAISIASRDEYIFIRKEGYELKEWPAEHLLKRCPQIILRKCSIPKLPERLDCAELKFLHLDSANNRSLQIPDSFFAGMGKLLVLDLTCMNISLLPTSLSSLTNLQTLCLRKCSLGDIARIGALKTLKILNLAKSSMEKLPSDLVKLTSLRMLDLSSSKIAVIPPNILASLTTLEELYMGDTSVKWEFGNSAKQSQNASLAELKQLPNLTALDIQIQDVWILPRDLMFDKLEKYKILIGNVWEWFDKYEAYKTLKLKLPTSIHLEHGIKALIKRVQSLYMDEINGISNVLYELNAEGFPLLKNLHIQNNNQIQHIINSLEWSQAFDSFPNLETLVLQNLSKLEKLCCGPLTVNSLSKLKVIKVKSCDQMKYLFSYSLVERLSQLISIEVSECSSMQKVVVVENDSGVVDDSMTDTIEFCGLQSLTLQNLPMLDGFCFNELATNISDPFFSAKVAFPNLETLNLTSINSKKFWDIDQLSVTCGIQNLTRLIVENCGNLKHLFSDSMIGSLPKLKQLEIRRCHMMEEIIDPDEGKNNALASKEVQFPSLEKIIINDMQKLRTVWHCQFDGLKSIVIEKCAKLVCIFPSYMQRKFHNLEILTVRNCDSVKEIFELDPNEIGCEEDVTKLANLTLDHLPMLKQIWSVDPDRNVSFPDLQVVHVAFCGSLEYLFPLSIATRIQKIEELYVTCCGNMKEIVAKKGGQMEPTVRFLLNQLTTLSLRNLRQLGGFYAGNYTLSCPSLKNIVLWECEKLVLLKTESMNSQERQPCVSPPQPLFPVEVAFPNLETLKLSSISLNKIWDDHQLSASCGIQNLTSLVVKDCGSLKHLFTHSMVRSLPKLKQLEISKCPMMEEIIDLEEGRDNAVASKEVQFACLEEIIIHDLENLRTTWHCQFDRVKSMVINNCGKLVCIFPSYMRRKFHSLEILSVRNCSSVKEIFELDANNTSCAEDMTGIHKLTLVRLPKLKQIWSMESEGIVCFHNLQAVHVEGCDNLEYLFPFSIATRLSKLEVLEVLYCRAMKTIVAEKEGMQGTAIFMLNQLISLDLRRMHHLRGFYPGNFSLSCPSLKKINVFRSENLTLFRTESMHCKERHHDAELRIPLQQPLFTIQEVTPNLEKLTLNSKYASMILLDEFPALLLSKLKILRVYDFVDEGDIFPDWFLRNVPSLENLVVEHSAFKEIFQDKIYAGEEGQIQSGTYVKSLSLFTLRKLQHICKEGFQIDAILEVLETLRVVSCSSLINLVPSSVAFSCLTSVEVKKCNGLIKLITCATAGSLVKLGTMKIEECNLLEEIVTEKEGEAKDEIVFGSLKILELISLPQLHKFSSSKCFIKFPMLRKVVVRQCPRMEIFSQGDTSTPRLHNVQVNDEEWCWDDNLNGTIHKMFTDKVGFRSLKHLNLSEVPELKDWWYHPQCKIFHNLKTLVVHKCDFLSDVLFTSNLFQVLLNLEELDVKDCDSIEEVFDVKSMNDTEMVGKQTTQLRKLTLSGLPKLKHIWSKDLQEIISFESLSVVQVRNCKILENLFPVSMCQDLGQLKELDIESCGVEEIVAEEGELEECRFDFPQLTRVRLCRLSKLKSFHPRSHTLECNSLTDLSVHQCEALQIFGFSHSDFQHQLNEVVVPVQQALFSGKKVAFPNLEKLQLCSISLNKIWDDHQLSASCGIQNLTCLIVKDCGSLKHLFTYSMVGSLPKLKQLEISKCPMMEEIIDIEEGRDKAGASREVQFPCLEEIKIIDLENLRTAWHCQFDSVKSMVINNCGKLVYIFPSYMQRKFHSLEILSVSDCGSVKEIFELAANNTSCAEDMTGIHKLTLVRLPKLKQIRSMESEGVVCFHNLQAVHVESCDNLEYLFPFSIATRLSKLEVLEALYCGAMKTIVAEKEGMQGTAIFMLNQLISLDLRCMQHLRGFYAGNYSLSCPSLKKINVFRCENLTLFRTESMNYKERHHDAELGIPLQQPLFTIEEVIPNLEKLTLNSKYARMILLDEFPALLFSKLKILRVSEFEDEGDIFPDWFLRNVPSLENLVVEHSAFKEIFQDKIYAGEEGQIQSGTHVKSLSLFTLCKLQHICKEGFQIDAILEVLETLRVVSCSSLINLVPSSVAFSCLTSVEVKKCNGLIKLITSATAGSLVKLRTMKVEECNLIEEIVTEKEGEAKDEIVFGSLKILELISLPQLNKFCPSKCFIKFPMLRKVVVRQCPRMEIFSQGDTSTPNLHNVQVNDEEWRWEDNLNGTIHKMFIDKVAFHGFKRLNLAEFSELKDFWYSPSVNNMFQSLKSLVVHKCDFLSEVLFTSSLLKVLQNLENLEVKDCDSIEAVFDVKGMDNKQVLVKQTTQMKKLTLSGLPKLKHIWNKDPHEIISFRNLRAVNVANCECLEYLFPSFMCRDLELLEELAIESCGVVEIVSKKEGVEECKFHFPQLTRMRLWSLSKLSNFYPRNHTLECPLLKDLNVYHCEALQIFDFNGLDAQQLHQVNKVDILVQQALFCFEKVCTGLEKLALDSKDMMTLQNGQHQENLFYNTNVLRLQSFHETAMTFPVDFLQRFPNLNTLVVRCSSFHTFHSPTSVQVEKLLLHKLEKLEFIWNEDNGSNMLVQHKSSEIDVMPSSFSFKNLILLRVTDCKALIYLITSSIAKGLVQLRKMIIKECEMEYAVKINEEVAEEEITFQNLEYLELNSLSRFSSFCSGKCALIFPSLMTLEVIGCPKMKIFSPGVVIAPMLRVVKVENERKRLNGDLNTIIKQVFVDKFVPNLEKLELDSKVSRQYGMTNFQKISFTI